MKTIAFYIAFAALCGCSSSSKFRNELQYQRKSSLMDIKAITLEGFMYRWMQNSNVGDKRSKYSLNEMHKDSLYTYFKKETLKTPYYYKVLNEELDTVDYSSVDGELILKKFKDEIIPLADVELVKNTTGISFDQSNRRFDSHYDRQKREIAIECKWKEHWGFKKLIDKKYTAVYTIDKKAFKQ